MIALRRSAKCSAFQASEKAASRAGVGARGHGLLYFGNSSTGNCPKQEYMGMSVRSTITTIFNQVAQEQQRTLVPISDDVKLLESGLDSLSFAIIVAKLEDETGFDPFNSGEMIEFPITFADFVRLYESHPR
jgi:acyl carrier protein